jgi:DNA-binding CsgD family transcriptional regulator
MGRSQAASTGTVAVAAAPAPPALRAVARSQISGATVMSNELVVPGGKAEDMVRVALQLRRWARADSGGGGRSEPGVAVASGAGSEAATAAALELARRTPPGRVQATAELLSTDHDWIAASSPDGADPDSGIASVHWPGPGAARRIELPLPGPVHVALDRPCAMLGREHELDVLARCWARAAAGSGSLALISGDPGAGKSRLAAEVAREVHDAGGLVLFGSGEDPTGAPYAPFAQALGEAARHGPPEFAERLRKSPFGRVTLGGVDERRALEGSLGDERGELFSSAIEGLGRLGERQPVLIVIEDLHSCGRASLQLLGRLAHAAPSLPLMVLTTYRLTDLDPSDPDAGAIAELGSRPDTVRIELTPLPATALLGIAAAFNPGAEGAELEATARAAGRDTAGNALYAVELLRSGLVGGAANATPRSLRLLIVSRTRGLGAAALEHLSAAAVAGRHFDPTVIARALEIEEAPMLDSIARGERAGLLTADPGNNSCTFTHAITARSLSDEIGAAARADLHERIARALEELEGDSADPALLARHWEQAGAGNEGHASALYAKAGDRALRAYDHERALLCFQQALSLHNRAGDDPLRRCDLLIGLGRAMRFSGGTEYREILLEAARLADKLDDSTRLAEAALANHRGFVSLVGGLDRERLAMLARAAERITEPGAERCLLLAQLALERTFSADLEARRQLADEALEIARGLDDQRILARVLIHHLIAGWGPDDSRERAATAAESIAISSSLGEELDLFHGLHWRAAALIEQGDIGAAEGALREQEAIAARVGDPTALWLCEWAGSVLQSLRGELEQAEAAAERGLRLAEASSQPDGGSFYASAISAIRWQQGRLPELAPLLAEALDQNPGLPSFASLVALANALGGDVDRARSILRASTAERFSSLPRDPIWMAAMATWAHAAAEIGDVESAEVIHPLLEPYRNRLASTSISIWGLGGHALGRLELVMGQRERGRRSLLAAVEAYDHISAPVWRVQAALDLLGDDEEALAGSEGQHWLAEARRVAEAYGARLPLLRARGSAEINDSVLERNIGALGLTMRQTEVARLLVAGHTNADIAAELQISARTVKRHAEDIYRRADVQGRAALAAGLLTGD